jgi:gamma-D-glutamyl-L-lysine dipeptidyl-peptidase
VNRALFPMLTMLLTLAACGSVPTAAEASPPPVASAGPSPSASPPAVRVRAGGPAYVDVAVATEWRSPGSPRAIDAPALANPVRMRQWLAAMTSADQAGLIGRADSQALLGEQVHVVALRGSWAQVVLPRQATPLDAKGYPGWIPLVQLSPIAPPNAGSAATVTAPTAWLSRRDGARVVEISFGTRLPVITVLGSALEVGLPGGRSLMLASAAAVVTGAKSLALPKTSSSIMASAREFLGTTYLWAGTSGFGFDCSGLMYNMFRVHGVTLPRDAQDQALFGRSVSRTALLPGDLVFLAKGGVVHHVAMYVGNGNVLDSPDFGLRVEVVSITSEPYASEFSGARRVLP